LKHDSEMLPVGGEDRLVIGERGLFPPATCGDDQTPSLKVTRPSAVGREQVRDRVKCDFGED
jgi:hypothetical protein